MEEKNLMDKDLPSIEKDIHVAVETKETKILKGDGAGSETLKAKNVVNELGSRRKVCTSSASVAYHRTNMYFIEIEGGLSKNELLFRLIHWWGARNSSKDALLIGLEMLLIDEQKFT